MSRLNSEREDEAFAKQIYLAHRGSDFFMERAGVYGTYLQFGVSREKEMGWAKEESARLLKEFVGSGPGTVATYRKLVDFIRKADDIKCLHTMLKLVRQEMASLDTMTLVMVAEATLKLMKNPGRTGVCNQRDMLEEEFILIGDLLKRASNMEFCVEPEFYKLGYMEGLMSEGQIRDRIIEDVRELESYSFPWDYKGGFWKWLRSRIP